MVKVEDQLVLQQVIGIIRTDIDCRIPLLNRTAVSRNRNGGVQVVLNLIFVTGRLEFWGRYNLAFNKAIGQGHTSLRGKTLEQVSQTRCKSINPTRANQKLPALTVRRTH